jgi:hypothetical protein
VARGELSAGLAGVALGEALGLPWAGVAPQKITRRAVLDDVGPTGPATAAALATARGEAPAVAAGTAAALPVALVLGWLHAGEADARRAATLPLGFGAVVIADLGAWALAGRPLHHLVAEHAKDWVPPFRGVAADQRAIADAVMANVHRHDDPAQAMSAVVRLGGDGIAILTALVGGILGGRRPSALQRVPWRERVDLDGLGLG